VVQQTIDPALLFEAGARPYHYHNTTDTCLHQYAFGTGVGALRMRMAGVFSQTPPWIGFSDTTGLACSRVNDIEAAGRMRATALVAGVAIVSVLTATLISTGLRSVVQRGSAAYEGRCHGRSRGLEQLLLRRHITAQPISLRTKISRHLPHR
jgi:hypothetical protein